MFLLVRDEQGVIVEWDEDDVDKAKAFRRELVFRGASRTHESSARLTVSWYRNELETLELVIALLKELGATFQTDSALKELLSSFGSEVELIDSARASKPKPVARKLPEFKSGRTLLPYQASAVGKHLSCQNAGDFSVPGSGKTTVAIAFWTHLRRSEPDLGLWVIGPLSCFRPWEDEFAACIGKPPRSVRLQGTSSQRSTLLGRTRHVDLVLCSYQTAWRERERVCQALDARRWLLVLDEAHYIKAMHGVLAESMRFIGMHAYRRMILTGTPMPKGPMDLWSLFTFLWPSERLLGNSYQHELMCRRNPETLVPKLRDQLSPFFYRTRKRDLELDDPVIEYPVIATSDIPASQRLIIRLLEGRTLEENDYLSKRDRTFLRRWRRARMIRLLQAASNPILLADALTVDVLAQIDEDRQDVDAEVEDEAPISLNDDKSDLAGALRQYQNGAVTPAKIAFVAEQVRALVKQKKKVVVWTVFLRNVDALADELSEFRPLTISGQIPLHSDEDDEEGEGSRESRIDLFKSVPERRVLIANMGSCSESISLHTACQTAIYLERNFNAAQFVQSMDRIHRQGMPARTRAHVIVPSIPCAVERVLNRRLKERQRQLYTLLNDPMPVVGFDDDAHRDFFDVEDADLLDNLFEEVLAEIRRSRQGKRKR